MLAEPSPINASDGRGDRWKVPQPRGGYRERDWGVKATLEIDDQTGVSSGITPAALAIDAAGNTYVVGHFVGAVHLGSSTLESGANPLMFVTKLNRTGAFAWTRQGDAPEEPEDVLISSEAQAVAVGREGAVVVAGVFSGFHTLGGATLTPPGGAFVARLNSSGGFLWVRQIGVDDRGPAFGECDATAVASDSLGNFYVAGSLRGAKKIGTSPLTSAGGSDAYVAKLDAEGRVLWATPVGSEADELGQSLAVNAQGEVWLAGNQSMAPGFDPATGSRCPRTRAFVTRLNADGTVSWTAVASGDDTRASAVVVDSSNNTFLTGDFVGNAAFGDQHLAGTPDHSHAFVVNLNSGGECVWATSTVGRGDEQATSIVLDATGNPYVSGGYSPRAGQTRFGSYVLSGPSEGGLFVGRLDRRGGFDWARSIPNSGSAWGQGIAVGTDGAVHLTGSFLGSLQVGAVKLTEPQCWNLFVARLGAAPPIQPRRIP